MVFILQNKYHFSPDAKYNVDKARTTTVPNRLHKGGTFF